MTRNDLAVIIRYALLMISGRIAGGGLIPPHILEMIAMDPVVTELLAGGILAAATFIYWKLGSFSAKALKKAETEGL